MLTAWRTRRDHSRSASEPEWGRGGSPTPASVTTPEALAQSAMDRAPEAICGDRRQIRASPLSVAPWGGVSRSARRCVLTGVQELATTPGRTAINEDAAFDEMVQRERRRLWTLALRVLRDEGEAEDAVQDTLVRAWRARASLGDLVGAGPWLTRVCINHCISRRRYLKVRGWSRQVPLDGTAATVDRPTDQVMDMDRAFRRLSLRQRAAVTLTFREGYSIDECAAIMGCRPGTVRSHVARGLATLHRELGDG
jgi:RNA polymerase sigma factor (sigma-70 family)